VSMASTTPDHPRGLRLEGLGLARARLRDGWPSGKGRLRARLPNPQTHKVGTRFWLRIIAATLTFSVAFGFGYLRAVQAPTALAADPVRPSEGDPRLALWAAADAFEARLATGGAGVSFTATQLQVLRPLSGGPDLLLGPDREHPDATPVAVQQVVLGSVSGRGGATADAFFAEWFNGTDDNGQASFQGEAAYQALEHSGALWRRDAMTDAAGLGWGASSDIPGFGVDPLSISDVPDLLRRLDNPTDVGPDSTGEHWTGSTSPLWYPGAVAVDGSAFTGDPIAIELWLDAQQHLVTLFAVARNTNESTYQMLCIDRVSFDYGSSPAIPEAPIASPPVEATP
jgi:hypothetical protein